MYGSEVLVTNVAMMGIRARFPEVPHHLESVRTTEFAYPVQHEEFCSVGACPQGPLGQRALAWEG